MALERINEGGNMLRSSERLFLTRDGRVVGEGDEAADSLLVGEGGTISEEDATRYGLEISDAPAAFDVEAEESEPEPKKAPARAAKKPAARKGKK